MITTEIVHDWADELRRHLPLSRPQATCLSLWSVGVALGGTCGQSVVSHLLAEGLHQKPATLRQRLREFCYEASAKCGRQRRALEVSTCFSGLLAWVQHLWQDRQMALALDATSLKDGFVVLSLSVLLDGCAVPVAWQVLKGAKKAAWKPHWLALLDRVRGVLPADWTVLVLTDRGLYAPWLFQAIRALGWHPLMRINAGGYFQPEGEPWQPLASLSPVPGRDLCCQGTAFKNRPVPCTLLVHCDSAHRHPWRLLTDLAPEAVQASWYGLRAWIEQGFKDLKRGGFQWNRTRMREPERVNRFWLVLAVTTLWRLAWSAVKPSPGKAARAPSTPPRKRLSGFCHGAIRLLARLLGDAPGPLTLGLSPQPWPAPFATSAPPLSDTEQQTRKSPKKNARKLLRSSQKTYP